MNIRKMLCAALLALVLLCAAAQASVPSAPKEFYFLDGANVLSEATEGEIFFSNQLLDDACGAQIVVVTTKSVKPERLDDFSYDLFNKWGIGDKEKQNGFLLVLDIGDEDYYALCGTNLQSKFTSGSLKQYFDDYLEADFAAGNYDRGAKTFFEAVFKRVADTYNAKVTTAQGIAAYESWAASANPAPMAARSGGAQLSGDYGHEDSSDANIMMAVVVLILLIILLRIVTRGIRYRRMGYGGGFPYFMFMGNPWRRTPPPPPPGGHMGPGAGAGGVRGAGPAPRPSSFRSSNSPGLGDFLRGSGFGAGRSSGGSRSSFGGGRSFGSARGGGGGTRGGGAGRGRH